MTVPLIFFQAMSQLLNVPVKQASPVLTVLSHHVTIDLVKMMDNASKMRRKMRGIFVAVSLVTLKRLKNNFKRYPTMFG